MRDSISLQLEREIDALCQQFEQNWGPTSHPQIEQYLGSVRAEAKSVALRELIAQEVDLRIESGEAVEPLEYHDRFPQDSDIVEMAFALLKRRDPSDAGGQITRSRWDGNASETEDGERAEKDRQDLTASRIGRFDVEKKLGEGGFGVVYLARDSQLARLVAIKVPAKSRFASAKEIAGFLEEARTAARLSHPGIVTVHDVGRDGEQPFIVQEYVEGRDLGRHLESEKLSVPRLAEVMIAIADAVGFAHQQGFTHRDLKPGNILMDLHGRPRVADFGLAIHEDLQRFREGESCGTPAYMSPEQVRGESHTLDGRSDIWSMGVMMYQMLTGRRPFAGPTPQHLLTEIQQRDPKPPRQIDPEIPSELARICLTCLAKDPADRYPSAADFIDDLRKWLRNHRPEGVAVNLAASAELETTPRNAPVPVARRTLLAGVAVAASAAALVLLWRPWSNGLPAGSSGGSSAAGGNAGQGRSDDAVLGTGERQSLESLVKLEMQHANPGFPGEGWGYREEEGELILELGSSSIVDISPIARLPLTQLHMQDVAVSDLAPLASISSLWYLQCSDSRSLKTLSGIEGLPLNNLQVFGCSQLQDLSPLRQMRLDYLDCHQTRVADLSPLQGMPLTSLDCHETEVADLTPLATTQLEWLNCADTHVTDLLPLMKLPGLVVLFCDPELLPGSDFLKGHPNLQKMKINGKKASKVFE